MKTDRKLLIAGLGLTFFLLQGCGGGSSSTDLVNEEISSSSDTSDEETPPAPIVLPTSYKVDDGRLLGSQCAQCHGTNGISTNEWDSIAGEADLLDEIYQDDEPIMNAQAHGYTQEEIILIGDWLKTLSAND